MCEDRDTLVLSLLFSMMLLRPGSWGSGNGAEEHGCCMLDDC